MQRKEHIIDAKNRVLGRLASQIVTLLRGKHKRDFVPYKDIGDVVVIKNISKMKITGKKMDQKKYYRHTGYIGGLKEVPLKKLFKEKPHEVLQKAVSGMLPKNKLRKKQMKRLKFEKE